MKRLVDDEMLETTERRLADLFRSAAPFQMDPFRKRRILVRLERKGDSVGARPFWLRPVVVATLLISGTAAAAFGQRYVPLGSLLGLRAAASHAPSVDVAVPALPVRGPEHELLELARRGAGQLRAELDLRRHLLRRQKIRGEARAGERDFELLGIAEAMH